MAAPQERFTNEPTSQDLPLVDRLALTGQALQDLSTAQDLYTALPPYHYNAYPAVDIAETQAILGINPTALTREARRLTNTERFGSVNAVGIYRGIARIQALTGKYEAALTTIAQAGQLDHRSVFSSTGYLDIARIALDRGDDPTTAFERAHEAFTTGIDSIHGPHLLGKLALLQQEAGLDPQPLLDEALQAEEAAEKKSGYGYKQVVELFAESGNFDRALELVQRIGGAGGKTRNDEARRDAMGTIAYHQAYAGEYRAAEQAARQTSNIYIEAVTACYVAHAAAQALQGDAMYHIESARQQIERYAESIKGAKDEDNGLMGVSFMLARLGEAQIFAGVDAQETFALAIAELSTVSDTEEKTDALAEVARSQNAVGLDASHTFDLALISADKIADNKSLASTAVPIGPHDYQLLAYEDLAAAAIDCGHYELIEPIMERMDRHGESAGYSMSTDKIKLLTMRARHAAGRGLTIEQIRGLTPAQITEVQESNNILAGVALKIIN